MIGDIAGNPGSVNVRGPGPALRSIVPGVTFLTGSTLPNGTYSPNGTRWALSYAARIAPAPSIASMLFQICAGGPGGGVALSAPVITYPSCGATAAIAARCGPSRSRRKGA